jgi:hypothetical protein
MVFSGWNSFAIRFTIRSICAGTLRRWFLALGTMNLLDLAAGIKDREPLWHSFVIGS